MDPETNRQTNNQFRRLPKGERRVRFADSMGMELVSIFLFDLINSYYFASIHNHKHQYLQPQLQLPPPQQQQLKLQQPPQPLAPTLKSQPQQQQKQYHYHYQLSSSQQHQKANNNNYNIETKSNSVHSNNNNNNNNNNYYYQQKELLQNHQDHHHNHNHQHYYQINEQQKPKQQQQHQQYASYNCEFTQPISLISFKERVKLNRVHLETCQVNSRAGNVSISCTIRVLNQSFDKSVIVRYTTDEWRTFKDCLASYKPGSCDGWSDKFNLTFNEQGKRIIFAIKYTYDGDKVSWDNNGGLNYVVSCNGSRNIS